MAAGPSSTPASGVHAAPTCAANASASAVSSDGHRMHNSSSIAADTYGLGPVVERQSDINSVTCGSRSTAPRAAGRPEARHQGR